MIYCRACGLYMTNGFCLHGNVEAFLASQAPREKRKGGKERKGC